MQRFVIFAMMLMSSALVAQVPNDVEISIVPGGLSLTPDMAVSGSSVYVVWRDSWFGGPGVRINWSRNRGATWLPADVRIDQGTVVGPPRIAVSGSSVFVVWEDSRNATSDVYFNRSSDGGLTWLAQDVRLNSNPVGTGNASAPEIAVAGSAVVVVWQDERTGGVSGSDIYCNRSVDGGATWLGADIRLDTDPAGNAASTEPRLATVGSNVYVVWTDERNGGRAGSDIYLSRSDDGGATWLASDLRIDTDPPGAAPSWQPVIAASGSSVYVTWGDDRNSPRSDIYVNYSADGGVTWQASDFPVNTDTPSRIYSRAPDIAVAGSSVYVTWQDFRGAAPDVRLNYSTDGGATWLAEDLLVNTDAMVYAAQFLPKVVASGSRVFVTWSDTRSGRLDIYVNYSLDGGVTWLPSDVRFDTDPAGTATSDLPVIAVEGDSVYVAWEDDRPPSSDHVFFNALCVSPVQTPASNRLFGNGCAHPQYGTPSLQPRFAGDVPYMGARFELEAQTLPPPSSTFTPLALLGLSEAGAPTGVAVPGLFQPGCMLRVVPVLTLPPQSRFPPTTAQWALNIPCSPSLVGARFFVQTLVVDETRVGNWTMTNGYEGTIGFP